MDHTLILLYIDCLYILCYLQLWHNRQCRIQKQSVEVFLKILQISQENACVAVSFLQNCKPSALQRPYTGVSLWILQNS